MIKITEEVINKPYFIEKGSIISNYPHYTMNPSKIKDTFELGKKSVEYRVIGYHESRDIINLISTHDTDKLGLSRLNVCRLALTSGFWWYDPFRDVFEEVENLFDKFLNDI